MHIYGAPERFPFAPGPAHKPPPASVEDYLTMLDRIGVERAVVVQPAGYGTDNRCTLEAVAQMGSRARGVATVDASVSDEELQRLSDAGMRGARFHMLPGGAVPWEMIEEVAAKVKPFAWHVQLQLPGEELPEREALLRGLPVELVIDHIGRIPEPIEVDNPGFRTLLGLVETGRCWVKLSAPGINSPQGAPEFAQVGRLASALVAAAPERMLWASNWPHPGDPPEHRPEEGMLLDTLLHWVEDETVRHRILVDNPAQLYGF